MQRVVTKPTLETISARIQSKRTPERDGDYYLDSLTLSEYDIRTVRDIDNMMDTLRRDGQLSPLTISMNYGKPIIINGRTRYEAMKRLGWDNPVACEVYENLDRLEQDYLNAIINVNQETLNSDERLRFVEHHRDQLDVHELSRALGITARRTKQYIDVSNLEQDVRDLCRTHIGGRERGEIEIDTAAMIAQVDDHDSQLRVARLANTLIENDKTDRARRTEIRKKVNAINRLVPLKEALRLTNEEITRAIIERPTQTVSLMLQIAEGSEGKFEAYRDLLYGGNYEEVIIFNPTFPWLAYGEASVKSEALLTVEHSRQHTVQVTLVDRHETEVEVWKKHGVDVVQMSAEEFLFAKFVESPLKTLIYFNLSGDRTAREFLAPVLVSSIKKMRPNATIAFVITEEWNAATNRESNCLELLRCFGIDRSISPTALKIEEFLTRLGYEFEIKWEKMTTRRVALVTI